MSISDSRLQAPNRQIRRLIEKENKKARDAEKKKYNDEVRVCRFPPCAVSH